MAKKQSILGRIGQLVRANINAMLDNAEDPQKMLDQMIRDYTDNIREAEAAIATTIGNLRLAQEDYQTDVKAAQEWGQKALAASNKADEFRSEGNTADADKFDNLAKVALQKQMSAENDAKAAEPGIAAQEDVVERLKNGLAQMKNKLEELRTKRNQLVARQKSADAQSKVNEALGSIDIMDPTSEISRFEEKIRRQEAQVRGQQELQASSIDSQFEQLEDLGEKTDVEARLAALKHGAGKQAPKAVESQAGNDAQAGGKIDEDLTPEQLEALRKLEG